jgi:hypothetical protein
MQSYGNMEYTRSGSIAVSLEARKLRLQPPVSVAGVQTESAEEEMDGVLNG